VFVTALAGPPYGVEGYLRIHSLSGETAHLAALKRVAVRRDGVESALEVERTRENGAGFFIKFKGIDTPEDARKWRGAELLVSRAEAAPLGAGEYYIDVLHGLALCGEDGERVGVVGDVIAGGAGSRPAAPPAGGPTRLIPFRDEFIGNIDFDARRALLRALWILE
jgi:16S rRNA processing protein RimM